MQDPSTFKKGFSWGAESPKVIAFGCFWPETPWFSMISGPFSMKLSCLEALCLHALKPLLRVRERR